MKLLRNVLQSIGLGLVVLSLNLSSVQAQETVQKGTLPLPEVNEETNMISNWRGGYPLPNSIRAWHYNPDFVMPMMEVGQAVQNSTLSYRLQMMIAAIVSSRNNCIYCLCSSLRALNDDGKSDSLMITLQSKINPSDFDNKTGSALLLAEQLTMNPSESSYSVENAINAGWDNDEIASIIFLVSYMNMMNRIAISFNLAPDESHPYDQDAKLPITRCDKRLQ